MNELESRLERAEASVAHLERQYDALNGVVVEQAKTIERLRKLLERLSDTLETQELERIRATSVKPPHYSA